MKKYHFVYTIIDNGVSQEFDCCDRLPKRGDVYEFTQDIYTYGGSYMAGDTLTIIGRTQMAPYNRESSLGNLLVKCKHGITVWTNIESSIAAGWLVLKQENYYNEAG